MDMFDRVRAPHHVLNPVRGASLALRTAARRGTDRRALLRELREELRIDADIWREELTRPFRPARVWASERADYEVPGGGPRTPSRARTGASESDRLDALELVATRAMPVPRRRPSRPRAPLDERRTRRVVAVQLAVRLGEVERNLDHIADVVGQAAREHHPDMIFLPEVSTTPNLAHRAMRGCVRPFDGGPLRSTAAWRASSGARSAPAH